MKKTFAVIPVSRFSCAKTRLSPKLTIVERENLLKAMLKDVITALNGTVENILIVSSDDDVLYYVEEFNVETLKEMGNTGLNSGLAQAMEYSSRFCDNVLILPSDVPLIKKGLVKTLLKKGEEFGMVIAPSKGGGTNALLCPARGFETKFGDYSFFEHIKEAKRNNLTYTIFDSFYLSLDVNTAEDLGEIMLHGSETETSRYLKKVRLKVKSNHGSERLNVTREASI
jgi:2-phospho-L-lactate guanylyltransferase